MIDLFRPPRPPIVNPENCSVVHIFMDGEPRYHSTKPDGKTPVQRREAKRKTMREYAKVFR